jgi:hypothetical protein
MSGPHPLRTLGEIAIARAMNLLVGLWFLVIGGGACAYCVVTGELPVLGFKQFSRARRPKDFWFFTSLYGFGAVVGLALIIKSLL